IGAPQNDGNGGASGHVRVYDYVGTDWVQRGVDLDGEATIGQLGTSVSLSADGLTLAIGAPYNGSSDYGYVRVYEWNGNLWSKVGLDIEGTSNNDELGISVDLSADGTTLVIGAQGASDTDRVEVYDWDGTSWNQRGLDITGNVGLEYFGYSVSISSDGNRFAVGAYQADDNGTDSGRVEVYDWNGTAWVQVGSDLVGAIDSAALGYSVSLSSDGSRLVVGEDLNSDKPGSRGLVHIYDYNGTDWVGVSSQDKASAVAISGDGKRAVLGYDLADDNGTDSGQVKVYSLSTTTAPLALSYREADEATVIYPEFYIYDVDSVNIESADITISGNYANGEDVLSFTSQFGITGSFNTTTGILSLSGSATKAEYEQVLASVTYQNTSSTPSELTRTITFEVNDGTNDSNAITATIEVEARVDAPVLDLVSISQVGNDLDGEAAGDESGQVVSLNEDGSIVAIGANLNDGTGASAGHVRIYQYDGTTWNQLGSDIDGEAANDQSGISIELSLDGLTVAIGAHLNDGNGVDSGHVRVYDYNGTSWIQRGLDIDGEVEDNESGYSLALSEDGQVVAVQSRYDSDGDASSGSYVRVYRWTGDNWSRVGSDLIGAANS
ncbi:FG-GAP repeat protein, partial [Thiotrichales bacterium 19S11-10]|nr:FG-GAP repeat protein [Thiotrichales bacterium 19S11-10]